jgi:hypothetical protein
MSHELALGIALGEIDPISGEKMIDLLPEDTLEDKSLIVRVSSCKDVPFIPLISNIASRCTLFLEEIQTKVVDGTT